MRTGKPPSIDSTSRCFATARFERVPTSFHDTRRMKERQMGHKCWAFKFEDGITRCTNQVGPFLFCRKHRAWPLTAALAFIIGIGGLEGGFGAMFDARAAVRSEFPSLFGVKPADMVNDSVAKAITEGIPYRSMYSSSLVLSQMMNLP